MKWLTFYKAILKNKNKMITEKEYNEAINVIEKYHEEIVLGLRKMGSISINKDDFSLWDKWEECSKRLKNVLRNNCNSGEFPTRKEIQQMQIREMRRYKECGKVTIKEFIKLRGF